MHLDNQETALQRKGRLLRGTTIDSKALINSDKLKLQELNVSILDQNELEKATQKGNALERQW